MSVLKIKDKTECKYDCISLGEVMLRFDPGDSRIKTARQFKVWEGGGEYNVSRGLRKCFSQNTAIVTAFAKNDIGYLVEDFILQGGVDTSLIQWKDYDGVGRKLRNGLNFVEKGFGIRSALGVSDRGNTAASQLKKGDIDWEYIFGTLGSRWFHTGGIFAALSDTTPDVVIEALQIAKKYNTIISYDLNYRPSLWKSIGGIEKAQEINKEIAKYVDVMIGNEEDFTACLGFKVDGNTENYDNIKTDNYSNMVTKVVKTYPNFKVVATTLRGVITASKNDWSAICAIDGKIYSSKEFTQLEIFDRVGGGDSFASGLIYGFLENKSPEEIVNYGAAHGALAMTTPGDTSMASLDEVERIVHGKSARVIR